MHFKVTLLAIAVLLFPFTPVFSASSLYEVSVLNNNFTPTIVSNNSPTVSTLTLTSRYAQIRHTGTAVNQYTGMILERASGNVPLVTSTSVVYSYTPNTAGTCTMAFRSNTSNNTSHSITLTTAVATTTVNFVNSNLYSVTASNNTWSLALGGSTSCDGTLRIESIYTNVAGVIPLSFSTLESNVNTININVSASSSTSTNPVDYSTFFSLFLIFIGLSFFALSIYLFRGLASKYL